MILTDESETQTTKRNYTPTPGKFAGSKFYGCKIETYVYTLTKSKTSNQKPVDIRLKYTFLNFDPKTSN